MDINWPTGICVAIVYHYVYKKWEFKLCLIKAIVVNYYSLFLLFIFFVSCSLRRCSILLFTFCLNHFHVWLFSSSFFKWFDSSFFRRPSFFNGFNRRDEIQILWKLFSSLPTTTTATFIIDKLGFTVHLLFQKIIFIQSIKKQWNLRLR